MHTVTGRVLMVLEQMTAFQHRQGSQPSGQVGHEDAGGTETLGGVTEP